MIDPGLMTDSTGEGMAGASDVALTTQQNLKDTYYNGSKPCLDCGSLMPPQHALQGRERCFHCQNTRDARHVKNGMVS